MAEIVLSGKANIRFGHAIPIPQLWWTAKNNATFLTQSDGGIISWSSSVAYSGTNVDMFSENIDIETPKFKLPSASLQSTGGAFFSGTLSAVGPWGSGSWMSGSEFPFSTSIQHMFLVISCSTNVGESPGTIIGKSKTNNDYFLTGLGGTWFTTSVTGSILTWGASIGMTTPPGRSNNRINIIHIHFRSGSEDRSPPLFSYNLSPKQEMTTTIATASYSTWINSKLRFGRRSNLLNDEASYSGWIFELRLYETPLTNFQTGSILRHLAEQWSSASVSPKTG